MEIAELVREGGFVRIDALARRYGVTEQTIRRDVNRLCEQGIVRRVHGGAGRPQTPQNLAYQARQVLHLDAKRRIARMVAAQIPDGASLFIGIGTTPEQVAHALIGRSDLQVMTNNLAAAAALADQPGCAVTIAGGQVRDRGIVGDAAVSFFSSFKVDYAVFGVGGIDADGTLLDFNHDEVRARLAMAANCRTVLLIADVTKFGRPATARGGALTDVHALFTDAPPPEPLAQRLLEAGIPVHLAGPVDTAAPARLSAGLVS